MSSYESKKNMTVNAVEISAGDYYKSWVAYDALVQASSQSSFRSVWKVLACTCCPEPTCWESQVTEILPANLLSRIRWYDHALGGENACSSANASTSSLSSADLHQLREHFVSHHQRIELILVALQPSLARICSLMRYQIEQHDQLQKLNLVDARFIVQECKYACNGWVAVTHLMRGVAKLDRMKYLKYVTSLAGVSGGNSPNMMALTHKTGSLESFFDRLSDETLSQHMNNQTPVGLVAQAFMDCLDALSRCWLDHVVTATTAIGITHGTKGTPNTILVERVLRRLHGSRLLKALGSLRTPMTGTGIEMRQLRDYETYPLADHYVALFDDVGPEFGTHSIGFPPRIFDEAKREFAEIRRSQRTKLWEYFYKTIRPAYCLELKRLLVGVDGEDFVFGIGLGSSVTEVLARLVASIQLLVKASDLTVWMADDEFVTFQRVAALLGQSGATVRRTSIYDVVEQSTVNLLSPSDAMGEEKEEQEQIERLVFVSLVNSCTQKVVSVDWIEHVPLSTIVVLDVTQAVANLPLTLGPVVVRPNVFLVGSLIKHARCGEGLGFLTYPAAEIGVIASPASGWTASLSGLVENETLVTGTHQLLYDDGLEWDGGTPSGVEASFVATRVLKAMANVQSQHDYVQNIKNAFLARVRTLLSDSQVAALSDSNTMAIPVTKIVENLPFGLDYKIVHGVAYLRIGFGIHNLDYHLDALVELLEATGMLS